jgi:hypothetical protein
MFVRIISTIQYQSLLSDFNPCRFDRHFFITLPSIKFNENPSVGNRADTFILTGTQTDVTTVMGLA